MSEEAYIQQTLSSLMGNLEGIPTNKEITIPKVIRREETIESAVRRVVLGLLQNDSLSVGQVQLLSVLLPYVERG